MNSFDRLKSADPAQEPDELVMTRIRRSLGGVSRRRRKPVSYAAAFTAFALIAGGGVAVGRITAPAATQTVAADGLSLAPRAAGDGAEMGDATAKDSLWWGGRVVLNPSASMSDQAGLADGFTITQSGVDKRAVLVKLAELMGARSEISTQDNTLVIGNNQDGSSPSATMYDDQMLNFYGYNPERSPWNCVTPEDAASYGGKEGSLPPDMRICNDEELKPANKNEAERAFTRVLNYLGLNADDVVKSYVDTGSPRVVMLQGMARVAGAETNMAQLAVSVSAKGVFNISGFAGRFAQVKGYQIVGAKTAAARSQLSKWIQLGPNPFGDWSVMPMARANGEATDANAFTVDGKPGVFAYTELVDVSKARLGLVAYYSNNSTVLLPSWIFTADDGRQWSMVALAEKYVKFGS